MTPLLSPPLGIGAPLGDLERLWLETSCYYACFNETVMEDTLWDLMAKELWDRREEEWQDGSLKRHGLSPYFCDCLGLPWPISDWQGDPSENPIKTAMGVNWDEGLGAIVREGIAKEGPKRLKMWESRIRGLHLQARRGPHSALNRG